MFTTRTYSYLCLLVNYTLILIPIIPILKMADTIPSQYRIIFKPAVYSNPNIWSTIIFFFTHISYIHARRKMNII